MCLFLWNNYFLHLVQAWRVCIAWISPNFIYINIHINKLSKAGIVLGGIYFSYFMNLQEVFPLRLLCTYSLGAGRNLYFIL